MLDYTETPYHKVRHIRAKSFLNSLCRKAEVNLGPNPPREQGGDFILTVRAFRDLALRGNGETLEQFGMKYRFSRVWLIETINKAYEKFHLDE